MSEESPRLSTSSAILIGGLFLFRQASLLLPSLAVLCGVLYLVSAPQTWPWWVWVLASPILYSVWLILALVNMALDYQYIARGRPKPRYREVGSLGAKNTTETESGTTPKPHINDLWFLESYVRFSLVFTLPLYTSMFAIPGLRRLMLYAYSPRINISETALVMGYLYDPDITFVEEGAIIGGKSTFAAHAVNSLGPGRLAYLSAPIRVGRYATVGGESRVAMGVSIGDYAILEAGSNVDAFTTIPPGEVWGGNPAVFKRRRTDLSPELWTELQSQAQAAPSGPVLSKTAAIEEARSLIAMALGRTLEEIPADAGSGDFGAWDSLGQMAIAAALHDRYSGRLTPEDIFQLSSVQAVAERMLAWSSGAERVSPEKPASPSPIHGAAEDTIDPQRPALWPLYEASDVTRMLARHSSSDTRDLPKVRVAVSASFVAEPMAPTARLWARGMGCDLHLDFCGYNQIAQSLLDPNSPFGGTDDGFNLVLMRPEDITGATAEDRRASLQGLLSTIEQSARRSPKRLCAVGTMPPVVSSFNALDRSEAEKLRRDWNEHLEKLPGILRFQFAEVVEQHGSQAGDAELEAATRSPYAANVFRDVGIALVRLVRSRRLPPAKVLAIDADNTLWGGVVGEDGLDGLQIGPDGGGRPFQLFQQRLLELQQKGILLTIVSRNEPQDVWEVFDRHPGMILKREHIAAAKISWLPKSQGVRELAAELNLGLDSFVFLDDDPAQRAEVAANAPAVTVVPLPVAPAKYVSALSRLWIFDGLAGTAEDASRTKMIQQDRERQELESASENLESYLQSLELKAEIRDVDANDLPRVAQLTQKTNQFNTSLKRLTLEEVQAFLENGRILVMQAGDRFGDYGLIGAVFLHPAADRADMAEVDLFLMSCRALGRGLEEALLLAAGKVSSDWGRQTIAVGMVEGPRNGPSRDFFRRCQFQETTPEEWSLSIDALPVPGQHLHANFNGHTLVDELAGMATKTA